MGEKKVVNPNINLWWSIDMFSKMNTIAPRNDLNKVTGTYNGTTLE